MEFGVDSGSAKLEAIQEAMADTELTVVVLSVGSLKNDLLKYLHEIHFLTGFDLLWNTLSSNFI